MKELRIISILVSLIFITYGCAGMKGWQKGALKGAAIGGALGSGIGAAVGSTSDDDPDAGGGALIGAGIGALAGGIIGGITGKEEKEVAPPVAKAEEVPPPPPAPAPPPPPPPPATEVEEAPPPKRIVFQNILFGFDKSTIKPESIPILKEVVDYLKENSQEKVSIEGHACWIGTESYNQGISERRVKGVKNYLVSQGIEENRLMIKGFGEKMPVADNRTREGRKLNRRVEFKIIE